MAIIQSSTNISVTLSDKRTQVKVRNLVSSFLFGIYALLSIVVPLVLLVIFRTYATKVGLVLDSGCHGPELPFGMLSGVLMVLQLRFLAHYSRQTS